MPRQREIVDILNTALQANNFAGRRFKKGSWENIAYLLSKEIKDTKVKQPVVVDNDGEGTDVGYDDTYPIRFYHRILTITPEDDQEESFGNPGNTIKETSEMALIIMGDKSQLKVSQEDIIAAAIADLPREISKTDLTTLTLQSAIIEIGEAVNDTEEVFSQEYPGVPFALAPENFMVMIKYKIVILYAKNCFQLCEA